MSNRQAQTVQKMLMAAGVAAGVQVAPAAWAEPVAEAGAKAVQGVGASDRLKAASDALAVSKVVRAREILASIAREGVSMSEADAREMKRLSESVSGRMKSMDRVELSLQKAELAVEQGDLKLAEQHAKAVATDAKADALQQKSADEMLAQVDTKRRELSARVPGALRAAANSYDLGRYEEARSILEMISRSGVELTPEQNTMLADYQVRVVAMSGLGEGAAAGMVQPGEIQPRRPEEPSAQPEKQPEPAPAAEQPAPAAAQPEPAAQPAAPAAQPPAADPVVEARKAEAARELSKANALFDEKKYNEAQAAYRRIRDTFKADLSAEQMSTLDANLRRAQEELRSRAGGNALAAFTEDQRVRKDQTLAEYNNFLAQARAALASGDVTKARQDAAAAKLRLGQGRDLFSAPEMSSLNTQVDQLAAEIEKTGQELDAKAAAAREDALRRKAEQEKLQGDQLKAQKIRELIDRVRALQMERKYREGLQVTEQILQLDPLNPTGQLLRDVLTDMSIYYQYNTIAEKISRSTQIQSLDNMESLIVPSGIVGYPEDWPDISAVRREAQAFQETPENRRVLATLENTRLPKVDFPDTTLEQSLGYLRTVANLNMDVDWPSLEAVGVQRDTTVSLSVTNPTLKAVLDQVLAKASTSLDPNSRAGWTVTDGLLKIGSEESLRRNKIMVIYDVQDLLFEVYDKTQVPEFDLQSAFQQGGGGGGGGGRSPFQTQNQNQQGQEPQRPLEDRIRELRNIITEQVDRDGWVDNGGDTGSVQTFQRNLIVTNTPKNHRAIEGLLTQLRRVRNMQISVEGRFLLVNQDFFEQIGFDVDLYLNARGNQVRFLRSFDYAAMPSDFFDEGGRYRGGNVASGDRVVDTDGDGIPDSAIPPGATPAGIGIPPPENFTPVGVTQNSFDLTSSLMSSSFASEIKAGGPALSIAGTFLDDIQVDFLVQATQADRRSVSLQAPRITITNGQYANVWVARQIAYVSDLEPQVAEGSAAFDPTIGYVADGVLLYVGGVILADRRYVTLDVRLQVSTVKQPFRTREVTAAVAGRGGLGGSVSSGSVGAFIELPEATVQSVETTVTVPDQGTLLLGGQRVTSEVEVESGVPVLSKIPLLNRLFSNRAMSREERTLLMLVKPSILIQEENEDKFYPGLRDALRTGGL